MRVVSLLGDMSAGHFAEATMHTPVGVTERALEILRTANADSIVGLGGGSTTGLAKALALRSGLPQFILPTTYAGSEMTPILGETKDGVKTTQRTNKVLPQVVIYDIDLTMTLPPALSGVSGMNAIAHAVESLYAQDSNPIVSLMALEGISSLAVALPKIQTAPSDPQVRRDALYGAWLCGICLGSAGMALHHKLCHTLGGAFDLPHAETHTVILPHAVAYNADAVPEIMQRIAGALGSATAAGGLYELAGKVGAPRSLQQLGMRSDQIEKAADLAVMNSYWNPRPVTRTDVLALLQRAFKGESPAAN
jgi:alcohol dehydrogenase class IV